MTLTTAQPAHPPENDQPDPDTEEKLARLYSLAQQEKAIKEEREALRDEILTGLDGSRYFIGPDGKKYYAYRVEPEPIEINVALLESYVSDEVINDVTERKIIGPKFKKAVETGRIPQEVFVKVARTKKQAPHIRFGDPSGPPPPYAGG